MTYFSSDVFCLFNFLYTFRSNIVIFLLTVWVEPAKVPDITMAIAATQKLPSSTLDSAARYRGYRTLWKPYPHPLTSTTKTAELRHTHTKILWRKYGENSRRRNKARVYRPFQIATGASNYEYRRLQGWNGPREWVTPDRNNIILWHWTTTTHSINKLLFKDFYDYLIEASTSVAGITQHNQPLPTLVPVVGTTRIWRYWSVSIGYDEHGKKKPCVDTFLALETESVPLIRQGNANDTTTTTTTTTTTSTEPPSTTPDPYSEKQAACYVCGLNETGIPRMPSCYDVFTEKTKSKWWTRKRRYKRHCHNGTLGERPNGRIWMGNIYRKGCFLRYTDVGNVYDERGCRTWEPTVGLSFASKRFASLEKMLDNQDEGCAISPHASLTPFSRAISLYVRYHVCVCVGDYCNEATKVYSGLITFILVFLILEVM